MGLINQEWRRRIVEGIASPRLRDPSALAAIGLGSGVLGTSAALVEDANDAELGQDRMSIALGSLLSFLGTPAAAFGLNQTLSNPRIAGKLGVTLTRPPMSPEVDALVSPDVATAVAQQPIAPEVQAVVQSTGFAEAVPPELLQRKEGGIAGYNPDFVLVPEKAPRLIKSQHVFNQMERPAATYFDTGDGIYMDVIPVDSGRGFNNALSNLAPRPFTYTEDGRDYKSVQHAYETLKSGEFNEETYNAYLNAPDGVYIKGTLPAARGRGGRDNVDLMKKLVVDSILQNDEAIKALASTLDGRIVYLDGNDFWNKEMTRIYGADFEKEEFLDTPRNFPWGVDYIIDGNTWINNAKDSQGEYTGLVPRA